ncbi:sensor histidine kinase [Curtobacterium sp. PhB115]|uniref:sensor histidine kinase n=1 Tax=Curtobacterium sp. PhB115 TaxID=2485173 RepID=UPI000FBDFC80|nr:histidine kinase [Curtobacterium sp. PhB115]ROP74620.1 signal transduction histidine kinase [Curtobacterium sp. PhB115]
MWSRPPARDPRQRRVRVPWDGLPVWVRDAAGGILLLVLSLLPLGVAGVELGELHHDVADWVPPVLIAGQSLALAARRVAPGTTLAVVGVSFAAAQLAGVGTGVAGLGLFVAIYSFAAHQQRQRRTIAAAVAVGYVLLAFALHAEGSPERLIDWATFFLVLTTPWFVGLLVRRRVAEQAARERKAADDAVREARNLLARDLHDIVTHHVTAMVVQADSTAYLDESETAERVGTLETIGATGRRALQELRSLLGALEQTTGTSSSGPVPREAVAHTVADLVAEAQQRGYPVVLAEPTPRPVLSDEVTVTLYRIAQEALTNAMKHSPGAHVEMILSEADGRVELRVVNEVHGQGPGVPGRGRRGMADRAALLGGRLDTGVVDGHFEVVASFASDARATPEPRR